MSAQHQDSDQIASANNHATQVDGTKLLHGAISNDGAPKKFMRRILPDKIAEVGEWKAEKKGDEADKEDVAKKLVEGPKSV